MLRLGCVRSDGWYPVPTQASPHGTLFIPKLRQPGSSIPTHSPQNLPLALPSRTLPSCLFLSLSISSQLSGVSSCHLRLCTVLLSGVPFTLLSDPLDDLTCPVASTTSGELVMLNVSELCVLSSSPVHSAVSASSKLSSSSLSPLGDFLFW